MKKYIAVLLIALLTLTAASCRTASPEDKAAEAAKVITVGASSTPHAEILEQTRPILAEQGFTLKIVVYDDYVQPNLALNDGLLDANYFQHTPYLDSFNASNGTELAAAALVHYEPFGLYSRGGADLAAVPEGTTVILPADDSNETRALLLLQQEGLITLPVDASAEKGVTTLDVVDDGGLKLLAVQADTVPSQLANSDEGTLAVINGNYALAAGLNVVDALAVEDASGDAARTYANVIAVRAGDEANEKTKALVEALKSDAIRAYMEKTYGGAVIAVD